MYNFNSIGSCLTRVGLGVSLPRVASLPHARKQTSTCTYNSFRIPFTDLHLRSPQSQQTVVLHYSSPNSPSNPSASTHRTLWDLGNKTGSINTRTSSILPHLSLSLYRTFSTTSHSCYAREALQMSDLDESDFGDSLGEDSDLFVEEPKVGFCFFVFCFLSAPMQLHILHQKPTLKTFIEGSFQKSCCTKKGTSNEESSSL